MTICHGFKLNLNDEWVKAKYTISVGNEAWGPNKIILSNYQNLRTLAIDIYGT